MKKTIRPLSDRLVIMPDQAEETIGGLLVPESYREKQRKGKVISVGSKVTQIQIGQTAMFGEHAGTELIIDKVEYRIMREEDVLAVI